MTYPRRNLFEPGQGGAYHCVSRCVRRAWLCGIDAYTKKSFEHRKPIVEARIQQLGEIFAVGIHTYAVMSNHLHVVLSVAPPSAYQWPDEEVARRWLVLYPPKPTDLPTRHAELCADPARVKVQEKRIENLSRASGDRFMKSLSEPIARMANAEDKCKGRFWEGRFKCQALLNEKAILAACAYVDLNPIRTQIATSVTTSLHTGIAKRAKAIAKNSSLATQAMRPLTGIISANFPQISNAEYIELVDWTGRQLHPGKRGKIAAEEPPALRKLGLDSAHWTMKVKGIGSGYWRAVGTAEELIQQAKAMGQHWLCGMGLARLMQR